MKISRAGKEVKNATVSYDGGGNPVHVTVDGVNYDPAVFKFEDDEAKKKTTQTKKTTKKPAATSGAMTTEDLK